MFFKVVLQMQAFRRDASTGTSTGRVPSTGAEYRHLYQMDHHGGKVVKGCIHRIRDLKKVPLHSVECGSVGVWECGSVGVWECGRARRALQMTTRQNGGG